MENLENYYVTGGFDIIKRRASHFDHPSEKIPIYTGGEGPNGARPRKSDSLMHMAVLKDMKVINREPY